MTHKITIYNNCKTQIGRQATFAEFVELCRNCAEIVAAIRNTADDDERKQLKQALPCATLSGVFEPTRSTANLKEHSGLLCIDIDNVNNPTELRDDLGNIPQMLYSSLSASGKGVFCVIPIAYPQKHLEHFLYLQKWFANNGITIDAQCKDTTRLRFISHDADAKYNPNAETLKKFIDTPHRALNTFTFPHADTINDPDYTAKWVDKYVRGLEAQRIDITDNYDDWLKVGAALASQGECYRSYYHRVSALSPKYNPNETDAKFTQCLSMERIGIGTFFSLCKDYGVQPL